MFNKSIAIMNTLSNAALTDLPLYIDPPSYRSGPGRKTMWTIHKAIGRSCYTPHQGKQEIARRLARLNTAVKV